MFALASCSGVGRLSAQAGDAGWIWGIVIEVLQASPNLAGSSIISIKTPLSAVLARRSPLMCGRYVITSAPEAIRALFRYPEEPDFPPRYNVAPTQPVPIVRINAGAPSFALMRWGLIPSWVKDPRNYTLLINARGETVTEKPAFRHAVQRRRCLFPADGFYEWRADGVRRRPYFIRPRNGGPIAFAGLWETWSGPNGEEVDTACIVTTT